MNKNRYLLCLLLCGLLLYYSVPRLSIFSDGVEGIFSITWLVFAFFVISGNLIAMLYEPRKGRNNKSSHFKNMKEKKRIRHYHS